MTQSLLDLSRCYEAPINTCRGDIRRKNPKLYRRLSQELTNCQTSCSRLMERFIQESPDENCIEVAQRASLCFNHCVAELNIKPESNS